MLSIFRNLWQYRYFVISSIKNDVLHRFSGSKLGGLWVIINPLTQVLIFTLILSNVLSAKLPGIDNKFGYSVYLMSGLLCWTLFNEIINRCVNIFVEQANLMKKVNFPRITLPVTVVGISLVNNLILFVIMTLIFVILKHEFTLAIFWIIPATIGVTMFASGLGLILGVFNVFVRDISQVTPIITQILFWLTPIVYPMSIIPDSLRYLLKFNPVFAFTSSYQNSIVYGNNPNLGLLSLATIIGLVLCLLALFIYRQSSGELVDVL